MMVEVLGKTGVEVSSRIYAAVLGKNGRGWGVSKHQDVGLWSLRQEHHSYTILSYHQPHRNHQRSDKGNWELLWFATLAR